MNAVAMHAKNGEGAGEWMVNAEERIWWIGSESVKCGGGERAN
jgi:hypothetical protein